MGQERVGFPTRSAESPAAGEQCNDRREFGDDLLFAHGVGRLPDE
jgi:hypothetical protein